MESKIIKTEAKEIFTKTKLPGADWVINQYVGCGHGCNYCYARFMSRWKGHGEWGSWIEAKINAPDLVKGKYVAGKVFMSSVSDAYQSIEKDLELTRKILESIDKNIQLSILTKSDLVLRDIELLKKFKDVEVGFTINSFSGEEKGLFEPDSPDNSRRIQAMKILKQSGIKTYAFVAPIIPSVTNLEKVIDQTKPYADYYWFEIMNLRGAGTECASLIKEKYPENYEILRDKDLLKNYLNEIEKLTKREDLKIIGIELH